MSTEKDRVLGATKWPERGEDATADALIVHGARLAMAIEAENDELMHKAFALDKEDPEYKPAMRRYLDSLTAMIAEAQVVIALVEVQKRSREDADALARRLWFLTEDGGVLPELMWDYLSERGVDAAAVHRVARAAVKEQGA